MSKKEAILKAAIDLFAERGFNATATSAIAKTADVAEGLIFHYFQNKNGILAHILIDMLENYIEAAKNAINNSRTGLEAIENFILFHFRFSKKRSKEVVVLTRDFPTDLLQPGSVYREKITARLDLSLNLVKNCLRKGQKDGSIQKVPIEKTAFIIQGMLIGALHLKLKMPDTPGISHVSAEILNFCRRSLAAES
jgi:AcrR family transcriptional regulator